MLPMIGHFFGPGGRGKLDRLGFRKNRLQASRSAIIASNMLALQFASAKDIVVECNETFAKRGLNISRG